MNIDEPTLTIVLGSASLIAGAMFLTLRYFARQIPGLLYWALGCLAVGTALLVDGPRIIEDWRLASLFFNLLFGAGQALILAGTMQFCERQHATRTLLWLIALRVVLTIVFTYPIPNSTIRIATLSIYQASLSVWAAWILWRYQASFSRAVFRLASGFTLLQASASFAQAFIVASSGLAITYAAPQIPLANIISWGGTMIRVLVGNWMIFLLVMLKLVGELKQAADLDLLTGLSNRRGLRRRLDAILERAAGGHGVIGVLLLDIDHFKAVNDRYGHQAGDKVLAAMGDVLLGVATARVAPCRWGGEEFCIVVEDATPASLIALAELVRSAFHAKSAAVLGEGAGRTVSVGVAFNTPGADIEIAKLMAAADAQLYRAKEGGRNQVQMVEMTDAELAQEPG